MALPSTMKSAIVTAYGGPEVIRIVSRPLPRVRDDTVLIRVHATTVNSGDVRIRALNAPPGMGVFMRPALGFIRPRQPVLGSEAAGTVVAVGARVTRFSPGDEVIAFPGTAMGCHAEYVAVSGKRPIVRKPDSLDFDEAAGLCFGGTTALHFLDKAGIARGERILVIGASGAVGMAIVQLAKHFGAHVTAVTSGRNADLVTALGADAVIDYTRDEYAASGASYDIIADTVAASSFAASQAVLNSGGRYLAIAGGLGDLLARPSGGNRPIAGMAPERLKDVAMLADLAARGAYRVMVDAVYPFNSLSAAHAHVDTGHKRGSVVVRLVD